jgi:hypothetical protein
MALWFRSAHATLPAPFDRMGPPLLVPQNKSLILSGFQALPAMRNLSARNQPRPPRSFHPCPTHVRHNQLRDPATAAYSST